MTGALGRRQGSARRTAEAWGLRVGLNIFRKRFKAGKRYLHVQHVVRPYAPTAVRGTQVAARGNPGICGPVVSDVA